MADVEALVVCAGDDDRRELGGRAEGVGVDGVMEGEEEERGRLKERGVEEGGVEEGGVEEERAEEGAYGRTTGRNFLDLIGGFFLLGSVGLREERLVLPPASEYKEDRDKSCSHLCPKPRRVGIWRCTLV